MLLTVERCASTIQWRVSDTVIVPDGGKLTLRMPDTSMISIAPGSSMSVAGYNPAVPPEMRGYR
jgi:hypothetical protein